eukprot:PhM_4_TR13369/c0_g1_i1/m.64862/K05863/SLC25A4S, ANT; solute carrier family 25 (mitochondrial adenine nucleotide translocator), member 4/5/6/31
MGEGAGSGRRLPKLGFWEDFMIGGIAGAVSKTVAAPAERVKLVLQSQHAMIKAGRMEHAYSGVISCFRGLHKNEGLLSFWKGNWPNVLRYIPTQAFNFAFRGHFKALFNVDKKRDGEMIWFCSNFLSGALAGTSSMLFTYSLDFARTRLANDVKLNHNERQFTGLIDVFRKTLATDGITGLHRGFCISALGIATYRGFYFGLYDTLKPTLSPNDTILSNFLLGWTVTSTAGYIIYPMDTLRRRMMMTTGESVKFTSSRQCLAYILKHEGYASLMRGAGANVLRGMAGGGVLAGVDAIQPRYTYWRLGWSEQQIALYEAEEKVRRDQA